MGILDMSYSCRNSQSSPFLHRCLSQCLQTIVLSPRTWRKGQCAPLVQVPLRKNSHNAALFSACLCMQYLQGDQEFSGINIFVTTLTIHPHKGHGPGSQLFVQSIFYLKFSVLHARHNVLKHVATCLHANRATIILIKEHHLSLVPILECVSECLASDVQSLQKPIHIMPRGRQAGGLAISLALRS